MRRCPIQVEPAPWLFLLLLASCGDAPVPSVSFDAALPDAALMLIDAAPVPDACPCRAQEMARRIGISTWASQIVDGLGVGIDCDPRRSVAEFTAEGELLGGSCVLEGGPNEHNAWLTAASPYWYHIFPRNSEDEAAFKAWFGDWRAPVRDVGNRIITTAACLLPVEEDAECARHAWVSHTAATATIEPQEQMDLRASCAEGVLVAGGCAPRPSSEDDIPLIRAGFAPDNRDEWLCSFVSQHESESAEVMAVAFCLYESSPLPAECGCCPSLADIVTVKQESEPLRSGSNRLEVQCNEDELLALGNCMIDVEDVSEIADVRMFRAGYPPTAEHPDGDRSTWGCSWYNPTDSTARAIATAVCLPAE